MTHWIIMVLIGLIVGGIAGFVTGTLFKSLSMGTMWNVITGVLCGYVFANVYMSAGFDDGLNWWNSSIIGCIILALLGGGLGQMFFGWIQYGMMVFWKVVTGKEDEIPLREDY